MSDRRRRFEAQALPHLDAAYNLARRLTRPPLDADDIVQDAMLRAFRAFETFRGDNMKPWLLSIVRNCHLTAVGQTQRKLEAPLPSDAELDLDDHGLIVDAPDPEASAIQTQQGRQLSACHRRTAAGVPRGDRAAGDGGHVLSRHRAGYRRTDRHRHVAPGAGARPAETDLARCWAGVSPCRALTACGPRSISTANSTPSASVDVERHLETCAECASLLADLEFDAPADPRAGPLPSRRRGLAHAHRRQPAARGRRSAAIGPWAIAQLEVPVRRGERIGGDRAGGRPGVVRRAAACPPAPRRTTS